MASLYTGNGGQHLTVRTKHRVISNNLLESREEFPFMAFLSAKGILLGESGRAWRPGLGAGAGPPTYPQASERCGGVSGVRLSGPDAAPSPTLPLT